MKSSQAYDQTIVELLKADPELADIYLATALEEANLAGGQGALLAALRQIAEAQWMANVAARAGIPRESLYRALGPKGNPTIKTFLAVVHGAGLHLDVSRQLAVVA
jgi:probable addiction module antidote protein